MPTTYALTNTIRNAGGPIADVVVRARLIANDGLPPEGGFISADGYEINGEHKVVTDAAGLWTLNLEATAAITPAGTRWEITEHIPNQQASVYYVNMPAAASTLLAARSEAPGALASAALDNHLTDPTDAHAASAVSFAPASGIAATDVQAAIVEAKADAEATTQAHLDDPTAAHAASAIANTPSGTVAATTVQAAIDELATDYAAADAAHAGAGDPHGGYQKESEKGVADGYASLDGGGKVPIAQLPAAIMEYQGVWDASTNTPTLADGTGSTGDVYRVSVAGTQNLGSGAITFGVGDYVIYNGTTWEKSDTTDAVATVDGRTGNVTLGDLYEAAGHSADPSAAHAASAVAFTPVGTVGSTDVQAAIAEIATEYAAADAAHAAGAAPHSGHLTTAQGDALFASVLDRAEALFLASRYKRGDGGYLHDLTGHGHHLRFGTSDGATGSEDPTFPTFTGTQYYYNPGGIVNGNKITVPHSAALGILGDIDLRAALALDDWTPTAVQDPISKTNGAGQRAFRLRVSTNGRLQLLWTTDGTTFLTQQSTTAPTVADGALLLIRATLDVDNGAGGHDVKFFTKASTEATAYADTISNTGWTPLGTTVTVAGVTSIFNATGAQVELTGVENSQCISGKFYAAAILSGIDGTLALAVDLTDQAVVAAPYNTFIEKSTNAATCTFRYAGSKAAIVVSRPMLLHGTDDWMQIIHSGDRLDFAADEPFTMMIAFQYPGTAGGTGEMGLITKGPGPYYRLRLNATTHNITGVLSDGTNLPSAQGTAPTANQPVTAAMRRSVADDTISVFEDGVLAASATDTTTGTLANTQSTRVGTVGVGASHFNGGIFGVALFRLDLSDEDVARAHEELLAYSLQRPPQALTYTTTSGYVVTRTLGNNGTLTLQGLRDFVATLVADLGLLDKPTPI